ncbi:MAG: hypothetical protein ACRDT6_01230 [Micromonosporaceae bacterium]
MFSTLLDGTTLTVRSLDQKIGWELTDGRDVEMWFEGDNYTYRKYSDGELGAQLAGLLAKMWSAQRSAHLAVFAQTVPQFVDDSDPVSGRDKLFEDGQQALRVSGASKSGRVEIAAVGMARWDVRIKPGTTREVSDAECLSDFWEAFAALVDSYRRSMAELRREIYPPRSRPGPRG